MECKHEWEMKAEVGFLAGSNLYQCRKCKEVKKQSPLNLLFGGETDIVGRDIQEMNNGEKNG